MIYFNLITAGVSAFKLIFSYRVKHYTLSGNLIFSEIFVRALHRYSYRHLEINEMKIIITSIQLSIVQIHSFNN